MCIDLCWLTIWTDSTSKPGVQDEVASCLGTLSPNIGPFCAVHVCHMPDRDMEWVLRNLSLVIASFPASSFPAFVVYVLQKKLPTNDNCHMTQLHKPSHALKKGLVRNGLQMNQVWRV